MTSCNTPEYYVKYYICIDDLMVAVAVVDGVFLFTMTMIYVMVMGT